MFVFCLYHPFLLTSTIPMAYNREWDRGKDAWADSSWAADPRATSHHGREDEYYGEGKRRKHNNGVCIRSLHFISYNSSITSFQGFDSSYAYDDSAQGSNYYHKNEYQDYGQDERHRDRAGPGGGGFTKKRLIPSEPSPHVIFLGLDPDFTEADVRLVRCNNSFGHF